MRAVTTKMPLETQPSLQRPFHAFPLSTVNLATTFNNFASN